MHDDMESPREPSRIVRFLKCRGDQHRVVRAYYVNAAAYEILYRIILVDRDLLLPTTPPKFKNVSTTTGTQINAGTYQVRIIGAKGVVFEDLTVE